MKKLLLATVLGAVSMTAMADDFEDSYNLVGLSYDNTTIMFSEDLYILDEASSTLGLNGFGLEYTHGFGITDHPMFIEVGGKFSFLFNNRKEDYRDAEEKMATKLIRLNIPVSYAYRFTFKDKFSLTPYAGFDFRFNLVGTSKFTYKDKYEHYTEKETLNWFNKTDVSDMVDDYGPTWSRFQFGWHIGVRFQYERYYAGLNYGTDFNPLFSYKEWYEGYYNDFYQKINWHTGNFALTLGYCF